MKAPLPRRASRRAFALPLVILLALVAALAGTLILELQSNSSSAVSRQTKVYEDHHLAAGMRELIAQWLLTGGSNIAERLEDDGLAFELDLTQGKQVRVYLEDAQGTVLRELSTVGGAPAQLLERIIEQLEPVVAASIPPDLPTQAPSSIPGSAAPVNENPYLDVPEVFRNVGPIQVSVNAASDLVLDAIAAACADPDAAKGVMRQIRARVGPGRRVSAQDLSSMISGARNLSQAHARELSSILTAEPILWRMTVETRHGSLSTAKVERAAALIQVSAAGLNPGPSGVVVLSWEDAATRTDPGDR